MALGYIRGTPSTKVWATCRSPSEASTPFPYSTPPQVVLPKKGFLPISIGERNEKLYFSLFIALKHLLLCCVLQGNLASHIHKEAALGLIVQLTWAIKRDLSWPGKVSEGAAKEPPGPPCLEDNLRVNGTPEKDAHSALGLGVRGSLSPT